MPSEPNGNERQLKASALKHYMLGSASEVLAQGLWTSALTSLCRSSKVTPSDKYWARALWCGGVITATTLNDWGYAIKPWCVYCGEGTLDTVHHRCFMCPHFGKQRADPSLLLRPQWQRWTRASRGDGWRYPENFANLS